MGLASPVLDGHRGTPSVVLLGCTCFLQWWVCGIGMLVWFFSPFAKPKVVFFKLFKLVSLSRAVLESREGAHAVSPRINHSPGHIVGPSSDLAASDTPASVAVDTAGLV